MSQTFGGQIFGEWYDTLSWLLFSAMWFYLAFAAPGFPSHIRQRLPSLFLSKPTCLLIASLLAGLALFSASRHQAASSAPIDRSSSSRTFSWKEIDSNGLGDSISVDVTSPSQKGEFVEYWSKIVFKVPRSIGPSKYASIFIDKYVVNCRQKTLSHVIAMAQSAEGVVINNVELPKDDQAFVPVPTNGRDPDSILATYVCSSGGGSA